MKNLLHIFSLITALMFVASCSTQKGAASPEVQNLVSKGTFTFMAEHANPTGYDVINVMNSLPGAGASRLLNLDAGYTIELTTDELRVTLPYFGRMYSASMQSDNSYRFVSKDFDVNRSSGKQGSTIFTLIPRDEQKVSRIIMNVFKNGKTYVSIDSNDRQPISYDGYITPNAAAKN